MLGQKQDPQQTHQNLLRGLFVYYRWDGLKMALFTSYRAHFCKKKKKHIFPRYLVVSDGCDELNNMLDNKCMTINGDESNGTDYGNMIEYVYNGHIICLCTTT